MFKLTNALLDVKPTLKYYVVYIKGDTVNWKIGDNNFVK